MVASSGAHPPSVLLRTTRFVNESWSQKLGASGVCSAADWQICSWMHVTDDGSPLADFWLTSMLLCTAADCLPADTGCSRPCSSTSSVASDDSSCREMMEQVFSALMGAALPCLKWQLQRDFGAQWRHVSMGFPPGFCQLPGLCQLPSLLAHCCSCEPHAVAMLASLLLLKVPIQLSCLAHSC